MVELTQKEEEVLKIGEKEGLIKIRENQINYLAQNKSYKLSQHEVVRAVTYVRLIVDKKYPPNRFDFEKIAPERVPRHPADLVVYRDDEREKPPFIVSEVESDPTASAIEEAKREGLEKASILNADWVLTVCGEEEATYYVKERPSLEKLEKYRRSEIPIAYGKEPKYRYQKGGDIFSELRQVSLNELHNKFQRCHDAIWEGGKRDPAEAFDEMSKLMFARIYDEKFTKVGKYYDFQIGSHENPYQVAARVKGLYKNAREKEPEVFKEKIKVPDEIISEVVGILQDISLIKTDLDSKGRAFEKFLGKVFRGELGQFFTPREIIDFMVKFVNPDYDELIMDPACGSSGFLLYSIRHVMDKAQKEYGEKNSKEIIWNFSHSNVFGIEINDRIARIAMMDMVIHDDGHTNIECNDALKNYENFDPRRNIKPNKYYIVLTNPPFGAVEKRRKFLRRFKLAQGKNSQKKEFLFIERCLEFLKPNGRLGIVLPDGILNNPTWKYVRDHIQEKADVLAVISLPGETFIPFGSYQKTSILFLRKKYESRDMQPEKVFMAKVENIGYDATGRETGINDFPIVLTRFEQYKNKELLEPKKEMIELSKVTEKFPVEEHEKGFTVNFEDMKKERRWDVEHFRPNVKTLLMTLKKLKCPKLIDLLDEVYADKIKPAEMRGKIVKFIEKISGEDGKINFAEGLFENIPKGALFKFRANTIVVSRINAKIKCIAILPSELNNILGTNEYYGLIPKENVSLDYLHRILRSEIIRQQIIAKTNGLYKRLKRDEAIELLIPFLPELQKTIENAKKKAETLRKKAKEIERKALENIIIKIEEPLKIQK